MATNTLQRPNINITSEKYCAKRRRRKELKTHFIVLLKSVLKVGAGGDADQTDKKNENFSTKQNSPTQSCLSGERHKSNLHSVYIKCAE